MSVYVVIWDNGEEYPEDFCEYVKGVFSSMERAVARIEGDGYDFDGELGAWTAPGPFYARRMRVEEYELDGAWE